MTNSPPPQVPEAPSRALGPALLYRLRRYAESLLEGPYNVLMGQIRWGLGDFYHSTFLNTFCGLHMRRLQWLVQGQFHLS